MSRHVSQSEPLQLVPREDFSRWYARDFDFVSLNKVAIIRVIPPEHEQALVIDASFVPKSGKKTCGLDRFWSGSHGRAEKGLEISALAWLDITDNCAYANHHRRLLDRCEACGAVVNFHRLPSDAEAMTLCHRCQRDVRLASAPALTSSVEYDDLRCFQTFLLGAMQQGTCQLPEYEPVHAASYFLVLQKLGQLLILSKDVKDVATFRQTFDQHLRQGAVTARSEDTLPYWPGQSVRRETNRQLYTSG